MPVFISHKKEDSDASIGVANVLRAAGIKVYLDVFDPTLRNDSDITTTLVRRVKDCTHLIAVVSTVTQDSWWVPFEIGVATADDKRVATYQLNFIKLPDYLGKWPILSKNHGLQEFIKYYKEDVSISLEERVLFDSISRTTASVKTAETFHRSLKKALGQ